MTAGSVPSLAGLFTRNWWLMLFRGIVAILFGIFALRRPGMTLAALVLLFGAYALIDGAFSLFGAIAGWRHREDRWLLLLEGFIGLGAGFVTLQAPDDAMLRGVLIKLAADRQLELDESVVRYLLSHIERSFAAVRAAVIALDNEALRQGRPVSRSLAAQLLLGSGQEA